MEGVLQDSRDLGDLNEQRKIDARKMVSVSYSTNTIHQSLSDSKLTNTHSNDNSKTNIIEAQTMTSKSLTNGKSISKQQRSNTIVGSMSPTNSNNQSDLVAVVIDGEHMFRCDSTYAVAIKNLVLNLKKKNLMTIFFNLRKPTHRGLMSTLGNFLELFFKFFRDYSSIDRQFHFFKITGEEEFYYCVLESQVYELINKFANQSESRDRSSSTSSETDHSDELDYCRPEKHWISQSTEAF